MVADEKPRVLIVEDEPDMNNLLADVMRAYDFRPIQATSAEHALSILAGETPDAILLDLMLPGVSGLEFCKHLKTSRASRTIPIIILTALDRPADKRRGYDAGADDYVTKPFTPEGLVTRLRACLQRCNEAREHCGHFVTTLDLAASLADLKAFNVLATCLYAQTDLAPEQIEALRQGLARLSEAAGHWAARRQGLAPVRLTMELDDQRLRLTFAPTTKEGEAFLAEHLDADAAVPAAFADAGVIDSVQSKDGAVVMEKAVPPCTCR